MSESHLNPTVSRCYCLVEMTIALIDPDSKLERQYIQIINNIVTSRIRNEIYIT